MIRVNKPKAAQVKAMFINELPKHDKALITDMIETRKDLDGSFTPRQQKLIYLEVESISSHH